MRELATSERIDAFFRSLGRAASKPCRLYVTGGVTAVILGFRLTTLDIDLEIHPESDEILRAIPRLKEVPGLSTPSQRSRLNSTPTSRKRSSSSSSDSSRGPCVLTRTRNSLGVMPKTW